VAGIVVLGSSFHIHAPCPPDKSRLGIASIPTRVQRSYAVLLTGVVNLLQQARRTSARRVNTIKTATYWAIGRRIVEHEQQGKARAGYGQALIERLATDLTARLKRGFSETNLMRDFYLAATRTSADARVGKRQMLSKELNLQPFTLP
jgi:DUF1016 N-terminal domain